MILGKSMRGHVSTYLRDHSCEDVPKQDISLFCEGNYVNDLGHIGF